MGEKFVGVAITAFRGALNDELEEGLERAQSFKSQDELPDDFHEVYVDDVCPWGRDELEYDLQRTDFVQGLLVGAFLECVKEYDSPLYSHRFETGDREIMFSGGNTWGDPPSTVCTAMQLVLDSGLYHGDRLSPEQCALKQQFTNNMECLDPEARDTFEECINDLLHTLYGEAADAITLGGWAAQLDYLFREYGDKAPELMEEFVDDKMLEFLQK